MQVHEQLLRKYVETDFKAVLIYYLLSSCFRTCISNGRRKYSKYPSFLLSFGDHFRQVCVYAKETGMITGIVKSCPLCFLFYDFAYAISITPCGGREKKLWYRHGPLPFIPGFQIMELPH